MTPWTGSPFETVEELLHGVIVALNSGKLHEQLVVAQEEFFCLRGKPVPGDPFFESFMTLFLEWFVLERPYRKGSVPLEVLLEQDPQLATSSRGEPLLHLLTSHHSLFEVMSPWKRKFFWLRDIFYGNDWVVTHWPPFPGIEPGQPMECRLVFYQGQVVLTPGIVVYPFSAREELHTLVQELLKRSLEFQEILELLSRLTIRSYRYSHLSPKRFFTTADPLIHDILAEYSL